MAVKLFRHPDVQVEKREVKAFVGDEKREVSLIQAKINACESHGEGYNGDRECRATLIEFLRILLLVMMGAVGLPIRDEAVFLFVGYQRVQSA